MESINLEEVVDKILSMEERNLRYFIPGDCALQRKMDRDNSYTFGYNDCLKEIKELLRGESGSD